MNDTDDRHTAHMREKLPTLVIVSLVSASPTLRLKGSDSKVIFGTDVSSAAVLSATCGAADQPTITMVSPRSFRGHDEKYEVRLQLGNVAPSCLSLSTLARPCATLQGTVQKSHLAVEPLFHCRYIGAAATVTTGPVVANATAIDPDDRSLGYSVTTTCPVPEYDALLRLGPYDGMQKEYMVNVSLSYWASSGPHAISFEYAGAPNGNSITFHALPAPPPPNPPSPPPWQHSAVFVHWGATDCPTGSELLYSSFMAGSQHSVQGGTAQYLCMHSSPQAPSGAISGSSKLYGVEYQGQGGTTDKDAACAMCQVTDAAQVYTQWGRSDSCSNGHTTLYTGAAMSEASSHYRTAPVCVDRKFQGHAASDSGNQNGGLLYQLEMQSGSADETKYPNGVDIGCSVCAVPSGFGTVYPRWGATDCPTGSELLYSSFMAGSQHTLKDYTARKRMCN